MPATQAPSSRLGAAAPSRPLWGPALLILVTVTTVLALVWSLVRDDLSRAADDTVLLIATALLGAVLVYLLTGRTVRTLARHTLTACLRTKVAAVFVLLVAAALGVLPVIMQGDGTLTGKVQTFLDYSAGITALLLSMVTIFLATGVVAGDMQHKQIFSLTSKPMSRWEYIVGRWLGLAGLNVILVTLASVAIYGVAQFQRGGAPLNPNDHRRLETEVFTARVKVRPVPIDIGPLMQAELEKLTNDPRRYEETLAKFMEENVTARGNRQKAHELLLKSLRQRVLSPLQSAPPGQKLQWEFKGIDVAGREYHGPGRVRLKAEKAPLFRIEADNQVLSRLVYRGPVTINGVEARVVKLSVDYFDAVFSLEGGRKSEVRDLRPDKAVKLTVDPVIQIAYTASADGDLPDNTLRGVWRVINPKTGAVYVETRAEVGGQANTINPPARVVDETGSTIVQFHNLLDPRRGGGKITILQDEISVLYRTDSFHWNFLRGMLLILLQLMFVGAIGVLAASFASFPVACLLSFALMPFSMVRTFLSESVRLPTSGSLTGVNPFTVAQHYVVRFMSAVLPNFQDTSPGDRFVDGALIAWADLGAAAVGTLAVRATLALLLACWIFKKREMARVQV